MTTLTAALPSLSEEEQHRQLRRAVIASTVGTTIEWYDFFLTAPSPGWCSPSCSSRTRDPLVGTLQAFAIYAVGFVARPVGAAIFGHYGDRVGRKSTLIATLVIMGLATFAVAFVPTYASIGIWGAVLLTLLRFIQGIGVGGEWGGSVLMSMEWTRTNVHRGFAASWPQFGVPAGLFLANLAVLAFSQMAGEQFLNWGWRIPFALSIVLVAVGLYIRLNILETPTFARLVEEPANRAGAIAGGDHAAATRNHPLRAFAHGRAGALLHLYRLHRLVWHDHAKGLAGLPAHGGPGRLRPLFLHDPVLWASVRSHRPQTHVPGRRGGDGGFRVRLFRVLGTGNTVWMFLLIVLSLIPHDMMYGPQAALIAESFTGRLRYSGASLGYQLASVIAGGPAPLIAAALLAHYHSGYAIAAYILFCALVSVIATAMLGDYTNKDISQEHHLSRAAT